MKNIVLVILALLIVTAGSVYAVQSKHTANKGVSDMDKNVLVAYFSATGTTKKVAENLAMITDGYLYEIKPEKPYTSADLNWHDSNSRSSIETNNPKSRPAITTDNLNIESYDTIYLGFPIWWGTAPRLISTFLEKYNFSNKTIILFATSGSSGFGETSKHLKPSVSDSAKIVELGILNGNPSVDEIKNRLKNLK